jgi:CheY-like chemotaxis protein
MSLKVETSPSTHKEYVHRKERGNSSFTIVCTQCKRVQVPCSSVRTPTISVRVSREDEGHWVHVDDQSDSDPTKSTSHGLCRTCFNNIHADLSLSPLSLQPSSVSSHNGIRKSISSPQLVRLPSPPSFLPRVLVVDDNRLQRQIHKRMVEQEGCECEVAVSGAHAIGLAQKEQYSVILMDLIMTPLDGWTTAKTIRDLPPSSSPPPKIIAVTGMKVDEKLREECRKAGMDHVVQKPISSAILNKLLH